MEVESTNATIDIENLSDEVEVFAHAGLEIFAVDFFERNPPCGHFGMGESTVGLDMDFGCSQSMRQRPSCVAVQGMPWGRRIDVGLVAKGSSEALGDESAEMGADLCFAKRGQLLIDLLEGLVWDPVDLKVSFTVREFGGV